VSPPEWWPRATGATLVDRLHTVPPWVMEVATYCIHLGAASAMVAAQLRLGEDLTVVEPGFPRDELSVVPEPDR